MSQFEQLSASPANPCPGFKGAKTSPHLPESSRGPYRHQPPCSSEPFTHKGASQQTCNPSEMPAFIPGLAGLPHCSPAQRIKG